MLPVLISLSLRLNYGSIFILLIMLSDLLLYAFNFLIEYQTIDANTFGFRNKTTAAPGFFTGA
ncbi:hypothetical protein BZL35_00223 [Candidatus Pandoraea novymonadis]|uniref:Uncharacterized protein n=1 Tax=Candidatus Pandoraea novymonadis TaxID=1808959 RepID=A0ABX5FE57_9BURK|nr:hypothetical protein BZL35_00223 [Candidatus Pandoraea novymonadis]